MPPDSIYEEGTLCAAGELQLGPVLSQPTYQNLAFNTTRVDGHQMTMGSPADSEQFYERLTRVMFTAARRLDHPILSRACPVKEYMGNGLTQRTTIIMYQDVAWQSRAAGSGGRNPVSTARSVISTLTRVGGAVEISKEHMATPEGQEHVRMQLQQLKQGMVNSALVYALSGMVSSKVDVLSTVLDNLQANPGDRAKARQMNNLRTQSMVGIVTRTTGALRRMAVWGNDLLKYYSQDYIKFWIMTAETRNALQCRPSAPGVPEITIPITSTTYDHEAPAVASDGSEVIIAPLLPSNMDGVVKQFLEVAGNVPSYITLPPGAKSVSVYNPGTHCTVEVPVGQAVFGDAYFMAKEPLAKHFVAAFLSYLFFTPATHDKEAADCGAVSKRTAFHAGTQEFAKVGLRAETIEWVSKKDANRCLATILVAAARSVNEHVKPGHVDGTKGNAAGSADEHSLSLNSESIRNACLSEKNDGDTKVALGAARETVFQSMTQMKLEDVIAGKSSSAPGMLAGPEATKDVGLLLLLLQYMFGSNLDNEFMRIPMHTKPTGGDDLKADYVFAAADMATHVANAVKFAKLVSNLTGALGSRAPKIAGVDTAVLLHGKYLASGWRCDVSQANVLPLRLWKAAEARSSTSSGWALAQQLLANIEVGGMQAVRTALNTYKAPHPAFLDSASVSVMLSMLEEQDLLHSERDGHSVTLKYRMGIMQDWKTFIHAIKRGFSPVKMLLVRPTLVVRAHHVLGFSGKIGNLVIRLPTEMRNTDAVATTETCQVSVYMGLKMDFPDHLVRFPHALLLRDGFTINGHDYDTVRLVKYTGEFEANTLASLVPEMQGGRKHGTFFATAVTALASSDRPIGFRTEAPLSSAPAEPSAVAGDKVTADSEIHLQVAKLVTANYAFAKDHIIKSPPGLVSITKWRERDLDIGSNVAAEPETVFAQTETHVVHYLNPKYAPKCIPGNHFMGTNEELVREYQQSGLPGGNGNEAYPNTMRIM